MIEKIAIGENRYGQTEVCLYNFGEARNLTLGQLVNAICCRAGTAMETQSISLVNLMTAGTRRLKAASKVLQTLVNGTEKGYDTEIDLETFGRMTARDFLTGVMRYTIEKRNAAGEVTEEGRLPYEVLSENNRLNLYSAMKADLDEMTTESQRRMIDLQSCMARRDVMYSTATNIVQTLGGVLQTTATNY